MILRIHSKNKQIESNISFKRVAELTSGFSGAELSVLINEAAIMAAKNNKIAIDFDDLENALNRVRKKRKLKLTIENDDDKWRVSVHESAHLSASFIFPCLERIESVSIYSPYQLDLFYGGEIQLPQLARYDIIRGTLVMLLSGRAAEEIFCTGVSTLSESDTATSTFLAYAMVYRWNMNENMGFINDRLLNNSTSLDLNKCIEVKKILDEAYESALKHIEQNANTIIEWSMKLYEMEFLKYNAIDQMRSKAKFKSQICFSSIDKKQKLTSKNNSNDSKITDSDECNTYPKKKVSILKRNKEILEIQVAALGINAPPHLVTQLEDIENELNKYLTDFKN